MELSLPGTFAPKNESSKNFRSLSHSDVGMHGCIAGGFKKQIAETVKLVDEITPAIAN